MASNRETHSKNPHTEPPTDEAVDVDVPVLDVQNLSVGAEQDEMPKLELFGDREAGRKPRGKGLSMATALSMIPEFDGTGSRGVKVRDFLQMVGTVGDLANMSDEEKILVTKLKAKGQAHSYMWRDPNIQRAKDFSSFCRTVIDRFDREPLIMKRMRMAELKQQMNESVSDFSARLIELGDSILPQMGEAANEEERLIDKIKRDELRETMKEHFCLNLRDNIRRAVLDSNPQTLEEAISSALRFETNDLLLRTKGRVAAVNTGSSETQGDDERLQRLEKMIREQSLMMEHLLGQSLGVRPQREREEHGLGERFRRDQYVREKRCYVCGSKFHFRNDCPDFDRDQRGAGNEPRQPSRQPHWRQSKPRQDQGGQPSWRNLNNSPEVSEPPKNVQEVPLPSGSAQS